MQRRIGIGLVAAAGAMLAALPAAQAEQEDTLSANRMSVTGLLSDGYRVVDYEVVEDGESRLILKKRYNLALCFLEESSADDESLEIESTCYRLR